jgi:hypothetical protein
MEIARQLSDTCVEGLSGVCAVALWVTDGCRAEFVVAGGYGQGGYGQGGGYDSGRDITCESNDRDNSCMERPWGRPQLLEQLSDDACREGYTWGYDSRAGRIWVTRLPRALWPLSAGMQRRLSGRFLWRFATK